MNIAELLVVKDGSFGWMLAEIQKEKFARRKAWPFRRYLNLNESTGVIYDCYFHNVKFIRADVYNPTAEDLIANDWGLCTIKEI
jgi:hypothetical protein